MHGRDKHRSRENRARLRRILRQDWDPIGVPGLPDDEYNRYADAAYVMLIYDQADARSIADYLYETATVYIGMTPYVGLREKCDRVGTSIFSLRREFEENSGQT